MRPLRPLFRPPATPNDYARPRPVLTRVEEQQMRDNALRIYQSALRAKEKLDGMLKPDMSALSTIPLPPHLGGIYAALIGTAAKSVSNDPRLTVEKTDMPDGTAIVSVSNGSNYPIVNHETRQDTRVSPPSTEQVREALQNINLLTFDNVDLKKLLSTAEGKVLLLHPFDKTQWDVKALIAKGTTELGG